MKRSERTCCVCRSKGGKSELARLVLVEGSLVWDKQQCASGRGAYIHLRPDCLSKMAQVSRWERALKLPAGTLKPIEVSALCRDLLAAGL